MHVPTNDMDSFVEIQNILCLVSKQIIYFLDFIHWAYKGSKRASILLETSLRNCWVDNKSTLNSYIYVQFLEIGVSRVEYIGVPRLVKESMIKLIFPFSVTEVTEQRELIKSYMGI